MNVSNKELLRKEPAGYSRGDELHPMFFTSLLCLMVCLLLLAGCTRGDTMYKESRVLMDTFCTITLVSDSKEKAREAIEAGFAEIKKLETLLNYFSDSSEISAVNRAAGIAPVKVSSDTIEILEKTALINRLTEGAFDPTLAPVIGLWDFSKNILNHSVPLKNDILEALELVDYSLVTIDKDKSEVYLVEKGMELDLGGIAKGFGADRAIEAVRSRGIKAALVAIAGDIRGYGLSASGDAWNVGIQNPRPDAVTDKPWEDISARLELKDRAISTSGDYQRYFLVDGKRYHHILDPERGFPAESDLVSATVLAPEGYLADSLSTAVFVLGSEKGIALLESQGYDGVLIKKSKEVVLTKGLEGKVTILNHDYYLSD